MIFGVHIAYILLLFDLVSELNVVSFKGKYKHEFI